MGCKELTMNTTTAALFDLDGVILDTEPQYSIFWSSQAAKYRPDVPDLDRRIKGRTLKEIFNQYFDGQPELQEQIRKEIGEFELQMTFEFIPGALDFIRNIRSHGVKTAIVTSSDNLKFNALRKSRTVIDELFDATVTAESVTRSKPDPEGYLLAAKLVGALPENSFVLEDAFAGMQAGRSAGMRVVGLATTFPADQIADKVEMVIPDFTDFSYEKLIAVRYK